MVKLKYKSLVTKETIDYYLSIIKDEDEKKEFLSTVSKFDIRIATEPVIEEEDEEFYYKIWILRRGTKKRAHIKQYYPLKLIDEERFKTIPLNLRDVLDMIRLNADVPDDFEEYCAIWFRDATDEKNRIYYVEDLARARRFKKFITKEEIRSIPFLPSEDEKENEYIEEEEDDNEERKVSLDLNNKYILTQILDYSIIFLNDKKEYDKLTDLQNILEYYGKIMKNYGYDPQTGDFNEKKLHEPKEEKQRKNIAKDFKAYFDTLEEYAEYLKELIKKYNIKQPPPERNLLHLAFNLNDNTNNNDDTEYNKPRPFKFIRVNVDWQDLFS